MCIKIVGTKSQKEFDPSAPLETQIAGAKEIVVSYDPVDPKIDMLVDEMERFCKNGISCNVDIKVNSNNYLNGLKLERRVERLKKKLNINEVAKGLTKIYAETDCKLRELSEMCTEKLNER